MKSLDWRVVPVCGYQGLDVHPEDLLNGGHFRKCEIYRGGGGYDQFPLICELRIGVRLHRQFVVQLYGCPLDCFYCYVTRSGVWNPYVVYTTEQLVKAFEDSDQEIFHLMGGAPALYLERWPELIEALPEWAVFYSDFLLVEGEYDRAVLAELAEHSDRCLFAVDIKGTTPEDYERNTRRPFKDFPFWTNLHSLVDLRIPFYLTFTNPDMNHYEGFCDRLREDFGPDILGDSFIIPLINYDATPYVDVPPNS
jgi:hypothetical protein